MYIGQIIQARVEKLVFQGKGLIRHQGWVIFVDDVAPGEEVQVKIIKKKKSFFIGKLFEIEVASPHRIAPRCPYFGTCGGCQLQHLEYGEQLAVKEDWINEALSHGIQLRARVGIEKASTAWEYRRKITLHFEWANGIFTLGYYAKDNRSLIDVKVCPIFVGEEAPILHDVRAYLLRLEGYRGLKGQVTLLKGDQAAEKYLLRFFFAPHIPHGAKEALQAPDYWSSIWLESPYESVKIKENPFQITPHVFLQNFPEQAFKLYNDIVTHVKPGRRVLDLYCGIGTLTELLGRQAALAVGVESNVEAILLARAKAGKTCSYHAGRVEELLPVLLKDSTFDTVIVNPPRIGISQEVAELLIRMKAPELIYISCDPATLQRDLTTLSKGGYLVEQGRAYDMFPQTTHLETVVYLIYNN